MKSNVSSLIKILVAVSALSAVTSFASESKMTCTYFINSYVLVPTRFYDGWADAYRMTSSGKPGAQFDVVAGQAVAAGEYQSELTGENYQVNISPAKSLFGSKVQVSIDKMSNDGQAYHFSAKRPAGTFQLQTYEWVDHNGKKEANIHTVLCEAN